MILVAVKSCVAHRDSHGPILKTWGKELEDRGFTLRFFLGSSSPLIEGGIEEHEVYVDCPDHYDGLSFKMIRILEWAAGHGASNLFTCDTDTYVDAEKLLHSGYQLDDYAGFTGMNGQYGAPHGGPGYWLSAKAVRLALESFKASKGDAVIKYPRDEWMVHYLLESLMEPRHDDRYSLLTKPGWRHDAITYHDRRLRDDPKFLAEMHARTQRGGA